ncbi:MAG: ATP-binding cassette domain-containing protein [Gammaproteobacteria bacterium]|nr:ATP-binding cassette domain-containing protein [Gammaproteobacteria bacterium]MYF37315.1 ATP-binding cassette domain-containing protein [Gammaproteobacteria bacterium]
MSKVVLENIGKTFENAFEILREISVTFDQESVNFIIGRSGAGKTTLIRILLGLTSPTVGRVLFNDIDITSLSRSEIARYRRSVGIVLQDPSLIPNRSIFDNVAMPLWVRGLRSKEIRHRVERCLNVVGLDSVKDLYPVRLSTGEQQRVSIARAIAHRPKLLVADEPTGNMDNQLSLEVRSLFDMFPELGTTVIVATHEPELTENMKHVFELKDGTMQRVAPQASTADSTSSNQ